MTKAEARSEMSLIGGVRVGGAAAGISYVRRVLDVQARLLAAVMVGEIREYQPMVTR